MTTTTRSLREIDAESVLARIRGDAWRPLTDVRNGFRNQGWTDGHINQALTDLAAGGRIEFAMNAPGGRQPLVRAVC